MITKYLIDMAKKIEGLKRPWVPERKPFEREVSNSDFYNSRAWRKARKLFLQKNPLCVDCEKEGLVVAATVVDHIIPINLGGEKLSESNFQSMCSSHHNAKSARESKGGMGLNR